MITVAAVSLIFMGVGIAGIWTRDIFKNPDIDLKAGFFKARDKDAGTLFWPHWFAEYGTAAGLIAGGIGLLLRTSWGTPVALLADGALLYTSMNSLGWSLAKKERRPYTIPMLAGLAVGIFTPLALLVF